jgi:hypothetical protein
MNITEKGSSRILRKALGRRVQKKEEVTFQIDANILLFSAFD